MDMAELRAYEQAKNLTIDLIKEWLTKYKFKNWTTHSSTQKEVTLKDKENRAKEIAAILADSKRWCSHSRPIDINKLTEMKLKIEDLSKYAYNNITMIINESNTQSESTSTTPAISDVSQAPSETPSTQEPTDNTPSPDINPTEKPAITFAPIDRNYNLEDDYSNRRFDLWKSGLEVYKDSTKNMLVGTTYYGMRLYSYENLPDTYLVNNSQTDFANFHNEFINILVAQGALGFISIVWMILSIIIYVIKNFKKLNSSNSFEFITAAVIVIILALASMFIPGVFYLFAPSSIVFWMFLGYAVMLLKKGNEQEN